MALIASKSILVIIAFLFVSTKAAHAEVEVDDDVTSKPPTRVNVRKRTTTIIEKDEDSGENDDETANAKKVKEVEITAHFGPKAAAAGSMAGCKTEDLAQKAIKGFKADCNAWLKDRKAELKSKYVLGSCEDTCDDCGMHLQRCSVDGRVRYR